VPPPPTWDGAAPPAATPPTAAQRARGALRLAAIVLATLAALALYLPGRAAARLSPGLAFDRPVGMAWARAALAIMGVRPRVSGAPMARGGVVLANHASWADILALRAAAHVTFVSKAEVRGWAGVGWLAAVAGTVFIDRRRSATKAQGDALLARLAAGDLLCLFPEGTSSDGLRVLPFKSALLSALYHETVCDVVWVQPVTLNWIAPRGQPAAFFGWWGTMGFEAHIWTVLCRSRGAAVEVLFHEPRPAQSFPDRKTLARHAEDSVRAAKRH
jgi:1-acyl-sn-glycerol-3-phosphate acyltransferase